MSRGLCLYCNETTGLLCVFSRLNLGCCEVFSAQGEALILWGPFSSSSLLSDPSRSPGSLLLHASPTALCRPPTHRSCQLRLAGPQRPVPCALWPRRPRQALPAALMVALVAPVLSKGFSGGTFLRPFSPCTRPSRDLQRGCSQGPGGTAPGAVACH